MFRKSLIVALVVIGLMAPASAAWAKTPDEVQAAAESRGAKAASLAEIEELVGPGEPEDIIYFCMLGWSGIIKFDENGAPTYYGYPDPDCPIFRYFMII